MIVVAILGGILVVGCCGGVVTVGLAGSLFWARSTPIGIQAQPPMSAPMPVQADPQVTKALDELNKDLEPLKIAPEAPEDGTTTPGAEAVPAAPALEEKRE